MKVMLRGLHCKCEHPKTANVALTTLEAVISCYLNQFYTEETDLFQ